MESSGYTVKEGYSKMFMESQQPPHSRVWQNIWQGDSLPKVNIFCWLMVHEKFLTLENMKKCGIQGPSRCALCNSEGETNRCLFLSAIIQNMYGDLFSLKFWKRLHCPTLGKKCLCHRKINTVVPSRKNQFSKGCGWRFQNLC